ncbi:unnamed protein product [Closterium sp. NIES-54]
MAEPPSSRAAQQPSRPATEQPSRPAAEPPCIRAAEPPYLRASTVVMATPSVLAFDAEGRAIDFDVWVDDLQLFLQCDRADGLSLFDLTSGASPAPTADADATIRSQWATRDAAARLAVRRHLPTLERAHFSQYKSAQTLYDAVVARYSSPTTAALSRLLLPYLFPDLAAFSTVTDLITHLRTSDTRYRAALPADFCAKNPPPPSFCRAQGIRQTFTLPASPQQNGIAERRIGMVMDVARTSMIQYAAHQLNLQPRVSLPETSPTLLWTGKVGDASAFRVWGSRAFVRDLSADKLSPRAVPCVFLGFPPDAPGWQFYHPTSRRVLSSQDVTFDESGPAPSGVSQVDAVEPVEVSVDSGAAPGVEPAGAGSGGAESGGAGTWGAELGGAEPGGAELGGAEPRGATTGGTEPGGAEPGVTEPGGAERGGAGSVRVASGGASSRREVLSPRELREWFARRWSRAAGARGAPATTGSGGTGPGGAGATGPGGAAEAAGVGPTGGSAGVSGGTGAAGSAGPAAAGATGVGAAGGVGAGGSADAGPSAGAGAGGATGAGAPAGSPSAVPAGSGGSWSPALS